MFYKPFFFELEIDKETTNTFRWKGEYNRIDINVYIKKWRIPPRLPKKIILRIEKGKKEIKKKYNEMDYKINLNRYELPEIEVMEINKNADHSEVYRYDTISNTEKTAIESIYVPLEFAFNKTPWITLTVFWEPD